MARKIRICVSGALHHVTAKTVREKCLYRDDSDKEKFMELLEKYLKITGFVLYSINLYPSHYHMIIRLNHNKLEALCRGMHSEYALYYNRKYKIDGYFFQGRPKTIPVEDGKETQELVRYTNSGPIRAGLCKTLEELDIFPWGSHSVVMNNHHKFQFLKSEDILSVFDNNSEADPRHLYREFMRQWVENNDCNNDFLKLIKGANQEREDMYEPGYWVIGSRKFVQDAIEQDEFRRARVAQYRILGWGHDNLAQYVCSKTSVSPDDLRRRGRMNSISDARKLFCYFAVKVLDMTRTQTALKLNVSRTAVAYLARQGEKIALEKNIQLPLNPI